MCLLSKSLEKNKEETIVSLTHAVTTIEPFQQEHLDQVQTLINAHLSTLMPGWALPQSYIADRLQRNPGEFVVDPWVRERLTWCALIEQRVVAVAHLHRYGTSSEVGPFYHGAGDLAWFLFWPEAQDAAISLLAAARRQFATWGVTHEYAWDAGLPIGPFVGIPDVWSHIARVLEGAGYTPRTDMAGVEIIYGGPIDAVPEPSAPPNAALKIQRVVGRLDGTRFLVLENDQVIGWCEYITDLTMGGALPALSGWGELAEIEVSESWRNRGIGTWLLQQAVAWHRLGGGKRVVLATTAENEAAGSVRFYQRFGWKEMVRQRKGWAQSL
jgi:GNAT superfamily N-acetyltransferase